MQGRTALHLVCFTLLDTPDRHDVDLDIVRTLLANGADVNVKDTQVFCSTTRKVEAPYMSDMLRVCMHDHAMKSASLMLQGRTALMDAAPSSRPGIVRILLEGQADVAMKSVRVSTLCHANAPVCQAACHALLSHIILHPCNSDTTAV